MSECQTQTLAPLSSFLPGESLDTFSSPEGVQTFIQGDIGSGAGAAAEVCSWQPSGQGVPIGPMCLEPEPAESSPLAVLWEAGMRGTRLPLLIPSQGEATSWPFPAGL